MVSGRARPLRSRVTSQVPVNPNLTKVPDNAVSSASDKVYFGLKSKVNQAPALD